MEYKYLECRDQVDFVYFIFSAQKVTRHIYIRQPIFLLNEWLNNQVTNVNLPYPCLSTLEAQNNQIEALKKYDHQDPIPRIADLIVLGKGSDISIC